MTAAEPRPRAGIRAVAMAVPRLQVSNGQIAVNLDVDADWIAKRTGPSIRPWAVEGERLSDFAAQALKAAVSRLTKITRRALDGAGREIDEIDLFVYHQANSRIIRAVGQRLGLDPERVIDYVSRFGNASTATLPIALSVAEAEGRLHPDDTVLLATFGGGFTWGATVVRWAPEAGSSGRAARG